MADECWCVWVRIRDRWWAHWHTCSHTRRDAIRKYDQGRREPNEYRRRRRKGEVRAIRTELRALEPQPEKANG